jgi:non-specific serine/threonine protein kinase/serine/threonine-protein kinase
MSNADHAERVAELVESALEIEPESWPSFLERECGNDESLRDEVESLLRFQEHARDFIETPALQQNSEAFAGDDGELQAGQLLGEYKILSLIGEGGMGEVYLAEDTALGRQVAIKVVKRGIGSRNIIRHFRDEERILASLNHPHIAQLYGGGATSAGAPYFVMEYVEGERLDVYCNERQLTITERLELFRKVCSAVTYAHQRLVIHRDIKPANIRVTGNGEPKLLDFGIAKLVNPDTPAATEQTITLAGAMTPEYASPEQVSGEPMTTASDVYSLGIVFYELLSGHRPYRVKSRLPDEIARTIREATPLRPSSAVGHFDKAPGTSQFADITPESVSKARGTQPGKLRRRLAGDLDNIALMATRKEPSRRYASVGQLAEDIRRHLNGLPIIARKDTFGYRSGKFIKRHKSAVAAAVLLGLTLLAGIGATAWEARRAERQRVRAEGRFNDVRRLANSLMFEIHDSVQDLQGATPTRRLIVSRALEYLDSLRHEATDDGSLQKELATAYEKIGDIQGNPYSANLGDTDGALVSYRKAIEIWERLNRAHSTIETQMAMGRSYRALGDILEQKGSIAETIRYYRESLALFNRLAQANPAEFAAQDELARAYETLGDGLSRAENAGEERLRCYDRALAIREQLLAAKPDNAKMRRSVATSLMKVGATCDPKKPEAVQNIQRAIKMLEALSVVDPNNARARREVGHAYYQLGGVQITAGDFAGALESRRKAFAIREQIATQDPKNMQAQFDLAVAHADLAEALTGLGDTSEALHEAHASLPLFEQLSASDPTNAVYLRNLGLCYEKIAEAHRRAASVPSSNPALQKADLAEAVRWFDKAARMFSDLKTRGTLMPADAQQPEKFAAEVAECQQALEQL